MSNKTYSLLPEKELRLTIGYKDLAMLIVFILHLLVFSYSVQQMHQKELELTNQQFEIDLNSAEVIAQAVQKSKINGDAWENNDQAHIHILRAEKAKDSFEDFLTNLDTAGKVSQKVVMVSSGVQNRLSLQEVLARQQMEELRNRNKLMQIADQAVKGEVVAADVNSTEVRQIVDRHFTSFRKCYESGLLVDEFLSGNVTIRIKVGGAVNVDFKGTGKQASVSKLKSCLEVTGQKIDFPSALKGKTIKFGLFFNS